jgi:hypothetical protein
MKQSNSAANVLSTLQGKDKHFLAKNTHTNKNISGLAHLNSLAKQALREQSPNLPDYAIPTPRFKDKTANELTRSIIRWLQLNGHQAERISVEGRVIDTRKIVVDGIGRRKMIGSITRIKSSAQRGSADVSATIYGRSVKVEAKIGRDQQSDVQKDYQQSIEAAGGIYLIASDFQGFYAWYMTFREEVGRGDI